MILRSVSKLATWATAAVLAFSAASCSRNNIEAINLANEGDKAVKIDVEGAISKYEQATQLDPTNHHIFWKLAKAYEKKEDWDKMASALSRALQLAPEWADRWYRRGFALMQLAAAGNKDKYEEAKDPLKKCIEKDPNLAECYHELAEASLWTDDPQAALDNYTKAIEHGPSTAYFYPPAGELYLTFKMYKEAEQVLSEGARIIRPGEKTNNNLYGIYVLLSECYQAKGDLPGMASILEKAQGVAGKDHPEIAFNLGSTYAVMDPPQKEKAVRLLSSFSKSACRSQKAQKFKAQCETSQSLIQALGGKVN